MAHRAKRPFTRWKGIYTFADSGEQRNARLYFVNGVLQQVFGFTGEEAAGAPREIMPAARRYLYHPGEMDGFG